MVICFIRLLLFLRQAPQLLNPQQGKIGRVLPGLRAAQLRPVRLGGEKLRVVGEYFCGDEVICQPFHRLHHKPGIFLQVLQDNFIIALVFQGTHKIFLLAGCIGLIIADSPGYPWMNSSSGKIFLISKPTQDGKPSPAARIWQPCGSCCARLIPPTGPAGAATPSKIPLPTH